ncbi:MAG: alpha/beta hydrolase [Pseudomonadota bacterium]
MFAGFKSRKIQANGRRIFCRTGGAGPPLLLLHGHPQTHVIWHKVADKLAEQFSVVAADLRGYGDSEKPGYSPHAQNYAKRVMALDQLELMQALGHDTFSILAHDRGARVAHRLAADAPSSVERMLLLDIAPTLAMYRQTNEAFARAYWHWFFLIRPAPLPESLIEADPGRYLEAVMEARSSGLAVFSREALSEYRRCLALPGTATGICEDYRASAGIDLTHDQEDINDGRSVRCPIRILWGQDGTVGQCFEPLKEWRKVASDVSGKALPCGHYIPEELPAELLAEAIGFFVS